MKQRTPQELWLLSLEAERYDTSWRKPKPVERYAPPQPIIVKQNIVQMDPKAQRERDQIMFHAGRFAAGARDDESIAANLKVGKLIHKKGTK